VLGDKIRAEIDELKQEQWLLSYIGKIQYHAIYGIIIYMYMTTSDPTWELTSSTEVSTNQRLDWMRLYFYEMGVGTYPRRSNRFPTMSFSFQICLAAYKCGLLLLKL
jgi:hypothetical protein